MKHSSSSLFYGGITVLIVVASFLYSWKFIIPKYRENRSESSSLDTQIASANKKLDSLKKSQTALVQLGDIPKQLSVAVPEDKDMPNLITELEAVAAKYKIIIPSMSITDGSGSASTTAASAVAGATGASSSGNTVSIGFAVPGSFDDINGLISDLEKDVRFMNIKSVSISSTQSQTGGSSMSVALQIEAYKRGAASATSSATPSAAGATSSGGGQ